MSAQAIRIEKIQDTQMSFGEVVGKLARVKMKVNIQEQPRVISLFSGAGGMDLGFKKAGFDIIFANDFDKDACETYKLNIDDNILHCDISTIKNDDIPKNIDVLIGGFPCQAFSSAGKRKGFSDIRGTLFFDIIRILKAKKPQGFILENVDGLVNHNEGKTFNVIIEELKKLQYNVNWGILNASDFGIPQNSKRIYIVGHLTKDIKLTNFPTKHSSLRDIIDNTYSEPPSKFVELLLKYYSQNELAGKSIKDRRGGLNNIHSWDVDLKGKITQEQKDLMNILLKKRRMKKWAIEKDIVWMDGMPLTIKEIATFFPHQKLQEMLDDLTQKKYLRYEYPKNIFTKNGVNIRKYDNTKEMGYNIVAGKLSFPLSTILVEDGIAPTIVEVGKLAIATQNGIRNLTERG